MSAARISRWSRRFVLAAALFLVGWRVADLAGAGRTTAVVLGLQGFVFHTLFGKGYALVPSYFDRRLALPRAPALQWPLSVAGTLLLAAGWRLAGALLWTGGVAVFLAALLWTVRDDPFGRATGTSEANAERRPVDRAANAFVPVALAYLALASWETLAFAADGPRLLATSPAAATHLLAAGTAALLVFAVGFRLLPRFLVAHPPRPLVWVVLPAGAFGPGLLAADFYGGPLFRAGAALEATAVVGFALAFGALFVRSDRRRVGFYGVIAGVGCGALGVLLGLWFAFEGLGAGLVAAHYRLNLLGFLGLTVVGVAYQFYPPGVGTYPGVSDRTALASLACLAGGLLLAVAGLVARVPAVEVAGDALTLVGSVAYAALLGALFFERHG